MKEGDAALKHVLKSRPSILYLVSKSLRNNVTTQIRKAKATFLLNLIKEAKGKILLWRNINKLLGKHHLNNVILLKVKGKIQNDSVIGAMHFSDYFIDSVQKLAKSYLIPSHTYLLEAQEDC